MSKVKYLRLDDEVAEIIEDLADAADVSPGQVVNTVFRKAFGLAAPEEQLSERITRRQHVDEVLRENTPNG